MRTYTTLVINPKGGSGKTTLATNLVAYFAAARIPTANIRLAVVANRVRKNTPVYQPLERFLASLNLPLLARLGDSEAYVSAAEMGVGIFEMEFAATAAERQQFAPIAEWVDTRTLIVESKAPAAVPFDASLSVPGRAPLRIISKGFSPT